MEYLNAAAASANAPVGWMSAAGRVLYRARQFWQAVGEKLTPEDLEEVKTVLTPAQVALFERMQPGEQAHSVRVFRSLLAAGERQSDLLVAALLHDAGKSRFPLRLWERALIVLAKAICPGWLKRWGRAPASGSWEEMGWRRAFIVAERHADWGAEMAAQAGASALAVRIIRRHQDREVQTAAGSSGLEERLLLALQAVDDES